MERKIIKCIYFVVFIFLTTSCDSLSYRKELCDKTDSANITALNEYNIQRIRSRYNYYMIYTPEGSVKIILSLENSRFYYKNYYSKIDSVEINAIVDVLRIIDEYEVCELYILGTCHYYTFNDGDMMVNGATKFVSKHPNCIKVKDNWYYYEADSF